MDAQPQTEYIMTLGSYWYQNISNTSRSHLMCHEFLRKKNYSMTTRRWNDLLNFEDYMYTKDNRPKDYSPKHVEKRFYEIQTRFNPSEGDKFLFVTVNPDERKHWFDWSTANNACNAFDFKMRRVLWKRKGRYIRPYVGCLETNETGDRYHFHGLLHISHVKQSISDHEIPDIARNYSLIFKNFAMSSTKGLTLKCFLSQKQPEIMDKCFITWSKVQTRPSIHWNWRSTRKRNRRSNVIQNSKKEIKMETTCPQKTITFSGVRGIKVLQELNRRKRHEHLNISAFAVEALEEKLTKKTSWRIRWGIDTWISV